MLLRVVVDSSVVFKWLYKKDEKYLDQALLLLSRTVEKKVTLLAPELAKYEVGNVLLVAKKLSKNDGEEALVTFYSLPVTYVNLSEDLARDTFLIGKQCGITFYDATFIALAKQKNAVLITANPKHQQKFPGVSVISLKDYK